jgi:hypothetical protein
MDQPGRASTMRSVLNEPSGTATTVRHQAPGAGPVDVGRRHWVRLVVCFLVLVGGCCTFQQGFLNTLHQHLIRGLRMQLGDEPDDVRDLNFRGWWVAVAQPTDLRAAPLGSGPLLACLNPDVALLVIQPPLEQGWLRVYEPKSGWKGYVQGAAMRGTARPTWALNDPDLVRWELGQSPAAVWAERALQLGAWSAFGLACLAAYLKWYRTARPAKSLSG